MQALATVRKAVRVLVLQMVDVSWDPRKTQEVGALIIMNLSKTILFMLLNTNLAPPLPKNVWE